MEDNNNDDDWKIKYKEWLSTPEKAVAQIHPNQRIFIGTGCAQPTELVRALTNRSGELPDTEIIQILTLGDAPYANKKLAQYFRVNSFFIAEKVRDIVQEGLGDYSPIFLSDIPRLFSSGQLPLDVALIQVTPPDEYGKCSLGISVDIVKSAAENARWVIAQVNPRMPRTGGDSYLHVHDLDVLVPADVPILEITQSNPDAVTCQIGENIAALIDDGSTIEIGIGDIPQSVLGFLKDKHGIGIHTEMFTDSIINLIEAGVITGEYKTLNRNKITASFCMGTRRLYDYVNNNPIFSFHPTEYINDPFVISRHSKMVAINVALEVDLTGQVCSDSLGTKFYSGIGGQVDFNRGASRSHGGKAIIAIPSTTGNGKISRIVSTLMPGAGVVTTRGDVHYVVTEYGTAYLHGKNIQERTIALISIAHPDFREKLLKEALEAKYLRQEMADIEGKIQIIPPKLKTSFILYDGTQVNFRSIHPTDIPEIKKLLYSMSKESVYYRFFTNIKHFSEKQIQDFVFINHRDEVALVGTVPEAYGENIVVIGHYFLNPKTNRAEIAFIVGDSWQNKGVGAFIFEYLTTIAKRSGIGGFTAEVMQENKAMRAVIEKSDCKMVSKLRDGIYSYQLEFV